MNVNESYVGDRNNLNIKEEDEQNVDLVEVKDEIIEGMIGNRSAR
jgi:hypothetical protein